MGLLNFARWYMAFWAAVASIQFIYINWFDGRDLAFQTDRLWHPYWFSWPQAIVLVPIALTVNLVVVRRYGGLRSHLGRAIMFLSLGIVMWAGLGNLVFFYIQVVQGRQTPPYPGLPDIGYVGLLPMYALGLYFLSKVVGTTRVDLPRLAIFPVIALAVTYWLTLPTAGQGPEWVLDDWSGLRGDGSSAAWASMGYLLSDIVQLSFGLILLVNVRRVAGGMFHGPVSLVVASLFSLYVADLLFDQRIAAGTYYTGDIASFFYGLSMYMMTFAVYRFGVIERTLAREIESSIASVDGTAREPVEVSR